MTPVVKVLRSVHIPQRMAPSELPSITELLAKAQSGDPDAGEALARAVNGELRALAATYLSRERGDHTLQPTALVNEAYLRLLGQTSVSWKNRAHFFWNRSGNHAPHSCRSRAPNPRRAPRP